MTTNDNETPRDELVAEVEDILLGMWQEGRRDEPYSLPPASDRIIALITAARDAEIRERLDLIYDEVRCENTDGMGGQDQHTAGYLEGLSVAIGLLTHGDETGGQE